ncbi:uL11 family ribosomal protein [Candidatus Nesciobacter abundans]|uniref:Large ribosomal subunit protein uL11 n=1 Tax=Candidatus Nesciobacter abundans TaxID=2601668 RepID=A0A5C0UII5_9PROT|nr:hypothetical protein [Candidatus Nesciobacter abundans]QEK39232.1 hypothetical protein FZC36_02235 [Candidatus Nesciobacter abundans]
MSANKRINKSKFGVVININLPTGGKVTPGNVGAVLSQHKVKNMKAIVDKINEIGKKISNAEKVPFRIYLNGDKFEVQSLGPSVTDLIKQEINLSKGSDKPGRGDFVAEITEAQLEEVAKKKMQYVSFHSIDSAKKIIAGSARSAGIKVIYN